MKIAVAGLGYVGVSNAALLSQNHQIVAVDIDQSRVDSVNRYQSPIVDRELEEYLQLRPQNLKATTDPQVAYADAEFVIVATPTDYDPTTNFFNTGSVEQVISTVVSINPEAHIVIKSTIPVGYTEQLRLEYPGVSILFSPEFLREGHAFYDNLHPSRIVVGDKTEVGAAFAGLLAEGAHEEDVPVLLTNATEAEAIKPFATLISH